MKVKIVFFSWDTFYGKLIKFGTGCKWTHVGIVGDESVNDYVIYEALNKGLVKNTYSKAEIKDLIDSGKCYVKEVEIRVLSGYYWLNLLCKQHVGKGYDWFSIFNIGYYMIFRKYALNIKGSKLLICSEFIARILYDISYKNIDFSKEYGKSYDYITPADIFNSKYLE